MGNGALKGLKGRDGVLRRPRRVQRRKIERGSLAPSIVRSARCARAGTAQRTYPYLSPRENSLGHPMSSDYLAAKMKIRVFRQRFAVALAVLVSGAIIARAQMPGAGGPAGMSAALTQLFGKTTAFTARGEMQVTDKAQKEVANWPMDFALLDRKLRVEIDLTQTKDMPASAAAMLKKIGMARVSSIIRPDKKLVYVMYPDQQVMLTMPLPKEDYEGSDKAPKVSKSALGKETIDGHPCIKNKVLITDASGHSVEAVTWDATDLKDLPIQIQTQENNNVSLVRFKEIQFERPALSLFEPPSGFAQYDNADDLKQGVMKKMMDSATKK